MPILPKEKRLVEICCHCGKSVAWGSGLFINRVMDFNDIATRKEMDWLYPEGDFVCAECDSKTSEDFEDENDYDE